MSLEQEIVVVIPLKDRGFTLPKKHREFAYIDSVFTDLDHTTKDVDTISWYLGRASYESGGIEYQDYTKFLPFVKNPERLRDYFVRGVGNTVLLFNFESISKLGKSVPLSIFEERSIFMSGAGDVTAQKAIWDLFKKAELTERIFIFNAIKTTEYLGQPADPSILRTIDKGQDRDEYMTYFSYYNRGTAILKNQYQMIDSLTGKGNAQSTMSDLWLNITSSFINLPEAGIDVFANVETADGTNVNQHFVKKDITVDLQNAGLTWLTVSNVRRLYNDNNLDSIAKTLDGVLNLYYRRNIIDSYQPTTWLPISMQDPADVANEIAKGFLCRYSMPEELKSFEVGLANQKNII